MGAQVRTSADFIALLRRLEEKPYDFDFFSVLRELECAHADKPRFGEAARPVDEPIRLSQEPSLAFAPSTLAEFASGGGGKPHRLSAYFLGLFGPQGPLPLHLTEFVRDREHNADDPTFRRFADIFHHRFLMLFYRAWADAHPAVSLDRPEPRRFDSYVGSTFGLLPVLRRRDAVPDDAKYYLSGLLGLQTRPGAALLAVLREFMQLPFRLREFVGAWMRLAPADWSRLGQGPFGCTLGQDTVVGAAVWNCQHRFRLICGPVSFADFRRLLPGRGSLTKLRDLVRMFVGDEFEWDVNLVLVAADVPKLELGVSGELGWTTWLGTRRKTTDADDVIVSPDVLSKQR